jgi:hypothetical protein
MGPISQSVALHMARKALKDQHSSVMGQFVSYKENKVL